MFLQNQSKKTTPNMARGSELLALGAAVTVGKGKAHRVSKEKSFRKVWKKSIGNVGYQENRPHDIVGDERQAAGPKTQEK